MAWVGYRRSLCFDLLLDNSLNHRNTYFDSSKSGVAMDDGRLENSEVVAGGRVGHRSLEEMHGTVPVPKASAGFWRQYKAFAGPALLVSVGYMDPGNWAT